MPGEDKEAEDMFVLIDDQNKFFTLNPACTSFKFVEFDDLKKLFSQAVIARGGYCPNKAAK